MDDIEYNDSKPYIAAKGEEFMNSKQLSHFQNVLLTWKKRLLAGANSTITHLKEDAEQVADMNDRATLEEEFTLELRTRDRERKLIEKINQSLRLIEFGEYGYCEKCGVEISLERLNARPTATQCIDCKTVAEKTNHSLGG